MIGDSLYSTYTPDAAMREANRIVDVDRRSVSDAVDCLRTVISEQ